MNVDWHGFLFVFTYMDYYLMDEIFSGGSESFDVNMKTLKQES